VQRSAYDDETTTWDGPGLHGAPPSLAELRTGPERIVGLDADLAIAWSIAPRGVVRDRRPCAFDDRLVYDAEDLIDGETRTGFAHAYAVDAATGAELWSVASGAGDDGPVRAGDTAVMGMVAYARGDGAVRWRGHGLPTAMWPIAADGDELFYASPDAVVELDAATGALVRERPLPATGTPVTAPIVAGRRGAVGVRVGDHVELFGFER
jgi:outer membrane protein assembly factor BamB